MTYERFIGLDLMMARLNVLEEEITHLFALPQSPNRDWAVAVRHCEIMKIYCQVEKVVGDTDEVYSARAS